MKARRRHELKENVLAAELGKTVEFFRKWGTYIAWGALIAALIVLVVVYSRSKSRQRISSLWARYDRVVRQQFNPRVNLDDMLRGLKSLVEQNSEPWIAANACVYTGITYARQASGAWGGSEALLLESPRDEAKKYYQRAIEQYSRFPQVVAKAHFGLGKLAEDAGELEQARAHYQAILEMDGLEGHPIRLWAKAALDGLEDLAEPVKMASTAPAQPTTEPAGFLLDTQVEPATQDAGQ